MDRCASCDIELIGQDVRTPAGTFCCAGCAEGGPCGCTYVGYPKAHSGNGHADPIVTWALLGQAEQRTDDSHGPPPLG
jgi:hypothetical protein